MDESARLGVASSRDPQMIYPYAEVQQLVSKTMWNSICKKVDANLWSGQTLNYICRQQTEPMHKNVWTRVTYTDTEPKKCR